MPPRSESCSEHRHGSLSRTDGPPPQWRDTGAEREGRCPACATPGFHSHRFDLGTTAGLTCRACGTLFFAPPIQDQEADYTELAADDPLFWRHYLEVGAGIHEICWPLTVVETPANTSLLDVGCGAGFGADYWRRLGRGESLGLEAAAYGRLGQTLLGQAIRPDFLHPGQPLKAEGFGVVYASEVIEHVPDPAAFLAVLREQLAPGGLLILTTPNAAFIQPENDPATVLAQLSPGFHRFLLTAEALRQLLQQAGLAQLQVLARGERLFAWASAAALPGDLPALAEQAASQSVEPAYLGALWADLNRQPPALPELRRYLAAIAYRLFKARVNAGQWAGLEELLPAITAALAADYGVAELTPAAIADCLKFLPTDRAAWESLPFYLPQLCYYRGIAARLRDNDPTVAAAWFATAAEAGERFLRHARAAQLDLQALLPNCRREQALAQLAAGEQDSAWTLLRTLATDAEQPLSWRRTLLLDAFLDAALRGLFPLAEAALTALPALDADAAFDLPLSTAIRYCHALGVLEANHRQHPEAASAAFRQAHALLAQLPTAERERQPFAGIAEQLGPWLAATGT